jgi:hypothetical protein
VNYNQFADFSDYDQLVLRGTGTGLRVLANRLTDHGPYKQITVSFNENDPYWNAEIRAIVLPLDDLRTALTNEGKTRNDSFVHLNALKVDWNSSVNVSAAYLVPSSRLLDIARVSRIQPAAGEYYNLKGQKIDAKHLTPGIYIVNGNKVAVK